MGSLRAGQGRRGLEILGWLAPAALLAVLPKCPVCFAAYIALATGISLPFSAAAGLRMFVVGQCLVLLGYLAVRRFCRVRAN